MHLTFDNRRRALAALGLGLTGLAGRSMAQGAATSPTTAYPTRAVRLLIGYPPGGGADNLGRVFAAKFGQFLGQPIVVENRPGAGATLAATALANAPADGYTLYFAESAILVAPAVYEKIGYDPTTFAPIGAVGNLAYSIVLHPSFPAKTTSELINVLKANPGKYSYASPGVGNIAHLSAELFKKAAGVDIQHIPYKGGTPALTDLVGGQVPICFVSLSPTIPLAKSGRLRLLAVTSAKRSPAAPDVPAIAETLPGFNAVTSIFLLAPPGTPAGIVATLNAALRNTMALPEIQADFASQGAGVETGSPQALGAQIREEIATWGVTARGAGAKVE